MRTNLKQFLEKSVFGRGLTFIVSSILSGLLGSLAFELLVVNDTVSLPSLLAAIALLLLIMALGWTVLIKPQPATLTVDAGADIPHKSFVITGLSFLNYAPESEDEKKAGRPSNLRTILNLVDKHEPKLKKMFFIVSPVSRVLASYETFKDWYDQEKTPANNPFTFDKIDIKDGNDMGEVRSKIKAFLIANSESLPPNDTILDVTAGTAAMSAGIAIAAMELGYAISYQSTDYKGANEFKGKTTWQYFDSK